MSGKTGIEWTDATWNPVRGCSRVSEGCRHCYAEKVAYRFSGPGQPYEGLVQIRDTVTYPGVRIPLWNGQIKFVEEHLLDPLKWKKPRRVFVNSMSDLFHENVTDEMLDRIFAVMALAPQHTFQVLTKRPVRMLKYLSNDYLYERWLRAADKPRMKYPKLCGIAISDPRRFPLANAWMGVSVENQKAADRLDYLCDVGKLGWQTMVSFEPLLGAVDPGPRWLSLGKRTWAIVGGESGPSARPMHPDWARGLRDQCIAAGVPFFFKQWGELKPICEMPEPEHRALYVSNKKAPEEWQQAEYDDVHGRRCTVCVEIMNFAGETGYTRGFQQIDGHSGMTFFHLGKKAAGRLLDAREWNQFPGESA